MVSVVNQWGNSYGQGVTLATVTPALQSCVFQLNNTYSVGGGSGTPTAGNWLFTLVSWTQDPSIAEVHIGVGDDIHSWWRQFPASSAAGNARTSISYTPNTARAPGYVYVAPDGQVAAINVLVVEVSGLGPWDTVTGPNSNYAAAATSLSLSLSAPGAASFFIGAAGCDSTAAALTFTPGGYTALHSLSQTNGTNHLADNQLKAAYLASSSSSQSISATASPATDLSGFLIGVYTTGTNPVLATGNPNWPHLLFEAAFGSGFNTPASEMTWTDISNRLWSWDETAGVQYQLGQLQATELNMELDNYDAHLSSLNTASPYYPDVVAGTPLRIRAAIGTIAGVTVNRWYVIQKNAQEWPEEIDAAYRRWSPATGTDIWAALSAAGSTPYRGEVADDGPYAWWPCDDQPGDAGVLPTALRNAAPGNASALNITLGPSGATTQYYYTESNVSTSGTVAPSLAIYTVGAQAGWMYGDPASAPASATAGGQVTAQPGSAAWQASGQAGNTGSNGWFMYCNDAGFPVLANGITVEGWWDQTFWGSGNMYDNSGSDSPLGQQPHTTLTLMELATGSHPVAVFQLDTSGHLNLVTYNGSTPTTHAIYTTTDLRSQAWFSVHVTLTTTTWEVWVNGGITAHVSGSATGMTSAWTWLILNGDLAANGGTTAGTGLVHGGNVSIAHVAIYPYALPYYRIYAHYQAAVTGFGLLPAPANVQVQLINTGNVAPATGTLAADGYAPDGTANGGTYNAQNGIAASAVVVATDGTNVSGPSAWSSGTSYTGGNTGAGGVFDDCLWVSWTGVAPKFNVYTAQNLGTEQEASVVCGSGESYTSGFGGSGAGTGVGHISGGSGASPPAAATAIGDTVAQRIERVLGYGDVTYPGRAIDPAALLVQAALDVGGQQAGQNVQNQATSDGGMLFTDNPGNLVYWDKAHLAAQYSSPVWALGPDTGSGQTPYAREIRWISDPQRIWNAIEIQPYSPTGASLPIITPSNGAGVTTSQAQYGAQPFSINSYLQSTSEMQSQADWIFTNFGQPVRRAENVKIDAATYPQAWQLVLGLNVGNVLTCADWQIGNGGTVYTYRVTQLRRRIEFGDDGKVTEASVTLQISPEPSSYWS